MNLAKEGIISSVKQINKRTAEVTIKVGDDFSFRAGQYIWLMIPELKYPDTKGNTRMFSIASSPNVKGKLNIIFRTGESGYKKTLMEMAPGEQVTFSGPYGSMELPKDNSLPIIFLAGGVGVAPFLSMIRLSNETHSGHKITLAYANKNEEEASYLDELIRIAKENPNFRLVKVFGELQEQQIRQLVSDNIDTKTTWSIIGPKSFVNFAGKFLDDSGIPSTDIIFEQFYPDTSIGDNFKQELKTIRFNNPFFLAVENAYEHIVVTDNNGVILYANKGAEKNTGYTFEEMKDNTARLWGGLMPQDFYKDLWKTKKNELQTFSGEVKNRRKNQDEYYSIMHTSPVFDENNDLVGFIATEEDITELKELDRAKTEFVALASHQLRTPLTPLKLFPEMLLDEKVGTLNSEQKEYVNLISQSTQRMVSLVNDFLNVSRLETGKFKIEPKLVQIEDFIKETIKEIQLTVKDCQCKLVFPKTKLPKIMIDPSLMRQVIHNLIINAMKYSPIKERDISVILEQKNDDYVISVKDNGIGIPRDVQNHVFQRFFRANNARKAESEGYGLGLYVCKIITEASGGKIWFESPPKGEKSGSIFYVSMPIKEIPKKEKEK